MTTLYVREESGYREADSGDVLKRAHALISRRFRPGALVLGRPSRIQQFLRIHVGAKDHEVFGLVHVDNRMRLIAVEDLFRGTLEAAPVYAREVVKSVLAHNSAAVVLFHNHTSGISEPSQADELVTRQLKDTLALVGVSVVDHIIVGEQVFSFAEHGLI